MDRSTKLRLQLKDSPAGSKYFSMDQLVSLEESFCVITPPGTQLVQYGETAPSDTSLPWQATASDGVTPVGSVKRFIGGQWIAS